ncbi:DUF927 domain-containing protein [Algibacter sp.]|nr:DUF927 domain-containing protein [Algibacter sp.]MDB4273869.1 DUF927 domain-containing protein [Algibacter sp.]
METNIFLKSVLADDGLYSLLALRSSDNGRIQKFYPTIGHLIDGAVAFDEKGYDSYFGLATCDKDGSRKADNMKELKSFFLDLDCGPSKDYANQSDALDALRKFCDKLKLPNPLKINSGRGVHVYWRLTESVGKENWLPIATRLKALCAKHNLLADVSVTADVCRVLRVPTTHNHKTDPPTEVTFFGLDAPPLVDFDEFAELLGDDPIDMPRRYVPSDDTYLGGKESVFEDIIVKTKAKRGCAQIKNIIKNQRDISEPLWRAGLSIAKYCIDGEEATHIVSRHHSDYTQEDTNRKVEAIKGPYLCNTFDDYSPNICKDCIHWGKIKSPIVLGQRIREATEEDNVVEAPAVDLPNSPTNIYTIPPYPKPYFRGANGGVYIRTRNAEGDPDEKAIYHNDLYVVRRLRDAEVGEAVVMRLHLPRDGVREFTLPLTAVTSRDDFRKQMSMQGVAVTKMDEIMQYTTTWVNELQANSVADQAHRQFGWTDDAGSSFVLGNQTIFKDRVEFNPPSTQTAGLFPLFTPSGTFEEWKEMIGFYNRDGFEMEQFVVGVSFGSILMHFSPINAAGLHLHGETGVGKTTAAQTGLTIWGDPEELMTNEHDTLNTRMNRGEVYHNLPLVMDELTNTSGKQLSVLTYQLTGGRQRGRMASGSNTERFRGDPWSLLSITTANASIVERISMVKAMPKAEAQRILECRVKAQTFSTAKETHDYKNNMMKTYGHAGIKYVQYIMQDIEGVKKLLTSVQEKIDIKANLKAENRFWSTFVAATVTGLILAKQAGLVEYEPEKAFKWGVWLINQNKRHVNDMSISVSEILNDYINEHYGNILWIKSTDDLRKQDLDVDSIVIPEVVPRGKLVARYETDLKRAYLVPKPLKIWCGEQQINYSSFINDLKEKLGARKSKIRLSKGTHMNLPPTDVIIVDCSVEKLDGNIEEE